MKLFVTKKAQLKILLKNILGTHSRPAGQDKWFSNIITVLGQNDKSMGST